MRGAASDRIFDDHWRNGVGRRYWHFSVSDILQSRSDLQDSAVSNVQMSGISGNLSVVMSKQAAGGFAVTDWSSGFAVMLAVVSITISEHAHWMISTDLRQYVAGGSSGALLNPSLTIVMSCFREFPARRIPGHILVQILGCFCGALLAFVCFRDVGSHG